MAATPAGITLRPDVTTHACPPDGFGIMPCCGRTPFEAPRTDRMALDDERVTCGRPAAPFVVTVDPVALAEG